MIEEFFGFGYCSAKDTPLAADHQRAILTIHMSERTSIPKFHHMFSGI